MYTTFYCSAVQLKAFQYSYVRYSAFRYEVQYSTQQYNTDKSSQSLKLSNLFSTDQCNDYSGKNFKIQ